MILPSRKKVLADMIFKMSTGYTNLDKRQIASRLGSRVCILITPNANMAGYPTKNNVFIGKILKDTLSKFCQYIFIFEWVTAKLALGVMKRQTRLPGLIWICLVSNSNAKSH